MSARKRLPSARKAAAIRSAFDAGKGSARLWAQYPPREERRAGQLAYFREDEHSTLWHRAMCRAFNHWLPIFKAQQKARDEREAERLGALRRSARELRSMKLAAAKAGFEFRGEGLNRHDSHVLFQGRELQGVRGMTVTAAVGEPTRVELDLFIMETTRLCDENPEFIMAPGTEESLLAMGWTPPGEPPSAGEQTE